MTLSPLTPKKLMKIQKRRHLERSAFTLSMLQTRWNKSREECIQLLEKFKVPGHLHSANINDFIPNSSMIDKAIFFQEWIYAIERRLKLPHIKLKPRTIEKLMRS